MGTITKTLSPPAPVEKDQGLSLVCAYNDEAMLAELKASLAIQDAPYELVAVNGANNAYPNAAAALKAGLAETTYDWVVFLHQDIELLDDHVLSDLLSAMRQDKRALYGAAGMTTDGKDGEIVSVIHEGFNGFHYDSLVQHREEATCLDECLFACHKDVFNEIAFDEETCYKWHFYAVDLCLQARLKGMKCYIVRCNLWHKSSGRLDKTFWKTERRIAKKYRDQYRTIRTTCTYFVLGKFRYPLYRFASRTKWLAYGRWKKKLKERREGPSR